jgi:PAS domain S-box-containing protein
MRAEKLTHEAEERYRLLVERLPAVLYIWDVGERGDQTDHYTSPMIEQLTGFTRAEWLSHPDFWADRIHPHDRTRVIAQVMACEETGEPYRDEYRILAKDGHVVWVHDHATLLSRDAQGRPHLFQGFMLDITDRKEAEAKALAAEERYRVLAEEGPVMAYDVILDHSADGAPRLDVQYLSPGLQRILGLEEQEWRKPLAGLARRGAPRRHRPAARTVPALMVRRRAVERRLPDDREGRSGGVDPRRGPRHRTRPPRPAHPVPGHPDRRHGAEGVRGPDPRGGGAVIARSWRPSPGWRGARPSTRSPVRPG